MTDLLAVLILVVVLSIAASIALRPIARTSGQSPHMRPSMRRPVLALAGRKVRRVLRQPDDAVLDRSTGQALFVVVVLAWLHLGLAAVASFSIWVRSIARRRRKACHEKERISADLADVIDLFAVSLLSGNTVAEAIKQICDWSEGDFVDAFGWCNRQVATGLPLGDVLELVPARLGPQTRPLIAALVSTERYGAPIAANLAQLATETRSDRRLQAEASARRLPVELLFPLVVCVLPAFLLVTVVPVIFETMSNFDLSASP